MVSNKQAKQEQQSLFDDGTNKDENKPKYTLFIVKNGKVIPHMNIEQIFDHETYDTFRGTTYSSSPNFVNKYIAPFNYVTLISSIVPDNIHLGNKDDIVSENYGMQHGKNATNQIIQYFNGLDDKAKEKLYKKHFKLYVPLTSAIHSKVYLLSNSQNDNTRIIFGSTNLSYQGFNSKIPQFEDIDILDNNPLFKDYLHYFNQLKATTQPYFSKAFYNYLKQKLANKAKHKSKNAKANTIIISNDMASNVKKQELKDIASNLSKAQQNGQVTEDEMNAVKNSNTQINPMKTRVKRRINTKAIGYKVEEQTINHRTKKPKVKNRRALSHIYRKSVTLFKPKPVAKGAIGRHSLILSLPDNRLKNVNTGLQIQNIQKLTKDRTIMLGKKASTKQIKNDLLGIQDLINGYEQYANGADDKYCSRVYEAILYCFEAVFLYEVRNRVMNCGGSGYDVPQFLFIRGHNGSGKSNLLKFIIRLMGVYHGLNKDHDATPYGDYVPSNVHNAKSATIQMFLNWIQYTSNNVAPIMADDIPGEFFSNDKRGRHLVVDGTNYCVTTDGNIFPAFIGTTNSTITMAGEANRRTYNLKNDAYFSKKFRQNATNTYNKAYEKIDSSLYQDFVMRFSNLLATKPDSYFYNTPTSKTGLVDFLYGARKIFEHYYKICKLPLPKFFPLKRFDDSQITGKENWLELYASNSNLFIEDKINPNHLIVNISKLDGNMKYSNPSQKPSTKYKQYISSSEGILAKPVGIDDPSIILNKKAFFKWIKINPRKINKKNKRRKFFNKIKNIF